MRSTDPQVQIVPEELAIRASSEVTHCGVNNTNDADDAKFKINDLTLQWYEFNLRKTQNLASTRSICTTLVLWPMRARDLHAYTHQYHNRRFTPSTKTIALHTQTTTL